MKLTGLALFGAGYILGTKAGRQRYEQIVSVARFVTQRFAEEGAARRRIKEYANGRSAGAAYESVLRTHTSTQATTASSDPFNVTS